MIRKLWTLTGLKFIYRLIGRGIDLYAEMKDEFDAEKEPEVVEVETEVVDE